ncbi:MAG: helix-turn-helix domain-containing protein [Elusimicrobia bacterium]|nr:helix-turn-helix domain-containing protein [Elusimicrobiota bacterium]
MRTVTLSGFDVQLQALLRKRPGLAKEYAKQFADLPLPTQLAIMRRRSWLSQRDVAKALRVRQPQVARLENVRHDPRLSSVVGQARALHCHLMLVPDSLLAKVARLVAASAVSSPRESSRPAP